MKIQTYRPDGPGMGYYVAELEKPNNFSLDTWGDTYKEVSIWCTDTFGHEDYWGEWPATGWKRMQHRYYFDKEDKLTLFILRWS